MLTALPRSLGRQGVMRVGGEGIRASAVMGGTREETLNLCAWAPRCRHHHRGMCTKGTKTGVARLYASYASSPPHFLSEPFSSIGIPEMRPIRYTTNSGDATERCSAGRVKAALEEN